MSSKYGRTEIVPWPDQGGRYHLSDDPDFEETNPLGYPRDVWLLKRPLNKYSSKVEKYRTIRNTLETFDSFGGPVRKVDRGLEKIKSLALHSGFMVGETTWDSYKENGVLRPRAKRWGPDELGNCRSKELVARGVTFTDREISDIYESTIGRINSQGGYHPLLRDCNQATHKGLKNLSAEDERLKRLDRERSVESLGYSPRRSITMSPGYSTGVVRRDRDRSIQRYYSNEEIYTRRTVRDEYDAPEFRRRATY